MNSVAIYADWDGLASPLRLGLLHLRSGAGRELVEFECDASALEQRALRGLWLDPRLGLVAGRQYPPQDCTTFGLLSDAGPEHWGRLLIRRQFERDQRARRVDQTLRLRESGYLLGVSDYLRPGALRFRLDDAEAFLADSHGNAVPTFAQLRELEAASHALERDIDNTAPESEEALRLLLASGSALGGVRPKANVVDPDGRLWVAKFPSVHDEYDAGAWELLLNTLARAAGLRVPVSLARRLNGNHHTFLARRFDRSETGKRVHVASAQTLTGRSDNTLAGANYLELARVLIEHGAQAKLDLQELWARIAFNVSVSNADDNLRNHGFVLVPGKGWRLSEAYDLNPVPNAQGLKLGVNEVDNTLDLDLVRSVAPYFRVRPATAEAIIARIGSVVAQWPKLAASLGIPAAEQERMADAFQHAPPILQRLSPRALAKLEADAAPPKAAAPKSRRRAQPQDYATQQLSFLLDAEGQGEGKGEGDTAAGGTAAEGTASEPPA
jgi:serine/threonine-protein kinase HipA